MSHTTTPPFSPPLNAIPDLVDSSPPSSPPLHAVPDPLGSSPPLLPTLSAKPDLLGSSPAQKSLWNILNPRPTPPMTIPSSGPRVDSRDPSQSPSSSWLARHFSPPGWFPHESFGFRYSASVDSPTENDREASTDNKRRLTFSGTVLTLIQEAERVHRETHPEISLQLFKVGSGAYEDDTYTAAEEFTVEGREGHQTSEILVRTGYKFGPWALDAEGSITGPKTQRRFTRPQYISFTPGHLVGPWLAKDKNLKTRELTITSDPVVHIVEPMDITEQVLKHTSIGPMTSAEYISRFGTQPTVTLSLTVHRPLRFLHQREQHSEAMPSESTDASTSAKPAQTIDEPGRLSRDRGAESAIQRYVASRSRTL